MYGIIERSWAPRIQHALNGRLPTALLSSCHAGVDGAHSGKDNLSHSAGYSLVNKKAMNSARWATRPPEGVSAPGR